MSLARVVQLRRLSLTRRDSLVLGAVAVPVLGSLVYRAVHDHQPLVVLLGLAWNRFAPSLPGEGPGGEAVPVQGNVVKAAPHAVKLSPGGRPGAHGALRIAVFADHEPWMIAQLIAALAQIL